MIFDKVKKFIKENTVPIIVIGLAIYTLNYKKRKTDTIEYNNNNSIL